MSNSTLLMHDKDGKIYIPMQSFDRNERPVHYLVVDADAQGVARDSA